MSAPVRSPLFQSPVDGRGGASSLPPTPMAAAQGGGGLGTAARLHDLSSDLRAIHQAMLPPAIHQALNGLRGLGQPVPDDVRHALAAILDHSESLLDALVASRLLEPIIDELLARPNPAVDPADLQALKADYENLIGQLAGRLGLGALDSILRADALGRLRGQVRQYRLTRWPVRGQPQPPAQPVAPTLPAAAISPVQGAAPEPRNVHKVVSQETSSPVARGWLRHPVGLPHRSSGLALGAATMAVVMPIMGAALIPSTPERSGTWAVLIGMTAVAAAAAILTSPFRWPARRRAGEEPRAVPADDHLLDDYPAPEAPPEPAHRAPPPSEPSSYDLWVHEVKRQAAALSAQGVPVETMDQATLTDWIERSGEEIAHLIDRARAQSIAADLPDDDENYG